MRNYGLGIHRSTKGRITISQHNAFTVIDNSQFVLPLWVGIGVTNSTFTHNTYVGVKHWKYKLIRWLCHLR